MWGDLKAWKLEGGSPRLESWIYPCDVGQLAKIQASHLQNAANTVGGYKN